MTNISSKIPSVCAEIARGGRLNSPTSKFSPSPSIKPINKIALASAVRPVPEELKNAQEIAKQTVVLLSSENNGDSGVIINRKDNGITVTGTLLTNAHVVGTGKPQIGKKIQITLPDGKTVLGIVKANGNKLVGNSDKEASDSLDIAVIEFTIPKNNSSSNFQTAKLGDDLKIGDKMLGVGTPFDSKVKRYSPGVVMDKTKSLSYGATLVSDTQIRQGMSGGGVFGESGKLIGINCLGAFPIFQEAGSDGKVYNWPDHSGAGDIEASTLKRFLGRNKIEYSK